MGAFASKTNVPAAVFGECSFDKVIYWAIPFDAMLTSSSRSYANFTWKPLPETVVPKWLAPYQR